MSNILDINIYYGKDKIAHCDHIKLDPYAISTGRKFVFQNVIFEKKFIASFRDKISIIISCATRYNNEKVSLFELSIVLLDLDKELRWIYGLIYHDYEEEYVQGVVDVFNMWEKEERIEWFSLPWNNISKENYISACLNYSGVSKEIIEREEYIIDMTNVKEYRDVLYLFSQEFFGQYGYIGHSFYSFADCLLEISVKIRNKKVTLKNTKNLVIIDDNHFLLDLVKEFSNYGIIVSME